MPDEESDVYFRSLRDDAWNAGGHAEADAAAYIMSDGVQDELLGICRSGDGCTLDVERKHALDKQCETVKTKGLATGSGDTILRQFKMDQREHARDELGVRALERRAARTNVRAVAIQRRPGLCFSRGRGSLHWEHNICDAERRSQTSVGNEPALKGVSGGTRGGPPERRAGAEGRGRSCPQTLGCDIAVQLRGVARVASRP